MDITHPCLLVHLVDGAVIVLFAIIVCYFVYFLCVQVCLCLDPRTGGPCYASANGDCNRER